MRKLLYSSTAHGIIPGMELITTHTHTDFDSLAAMIAAKRLYPEAALVLPGPPGDKVRRYLSREFDNLYLFSQPGDIDLSAVQRLVLVGTRQAGQLGSLAACLSNPGLELHVYDHHPPHEGDIRAQVEHVAPYGATSTLMVRLIRGQHLVLTPWEATLMALGIYDSTGAFLAPGTNREDLRTASWLLGQGAHLETIARYFSRALTERQAELLAQLQKNSAPYVIHGIRVVITWLESREYIDDAQTLLQRVMNMDGLEVLFAFMTIRGALHFLCRSNLPEINAAAIARSFGGSGQAAEAVASIPDMTREEAEEKLLRLLQGSVRPKDRAGELMSTPAIAVTAGVTLSEAAEMLTRYNFTVLPVVQLPGSPDGSVPPTGLLGMISRTVVEKAIYHALGKAPVSEYMTTGLAALSEDSGLADIIDIMVANRQRLIPVLRGEALTGVITRTDLLSLLVDDPGNVSPDLLRADRHPSIRRGRNLSDLMVRRLSRDAIVLLRELGETAKTQGCQAFVVGGFVRDLLLGHSNLDIDIVVEGNGIAFAGAFARIKGGIVRPHLKFNTATVVLPEGLRIDVATARLEYYEHPVALPTVAVGSIKRDLHRRDFTINAMAIALNPERFGTLADFYNSQNDLMAHRIQVLHNLSFVEDPTRIYRAIRFESRLGFHITRNSERLIRNAIRLGLPRQIEGLRCLHELRLILSEDNPIPALRRMEDFQLFPFLWPGLAQPFKIGRRVLHVLGMAREAIAWFRLLQDNTPLEQWLVYMLALSCGRTTAELDSLCQRLDMPERQRLSLLCQKEKAEALEQELFRHPEMPPSASYWPLRALSEEALLYLRAIARKRVIINRIAHFVTRLRGMKPLVDGAGLKALGYRPGPQFSVMHKSLLTHQFDGEIRTRDEAESFLAREYPLPGRK